MREFIVKYHPHNDRIYSLIIVEILDMLRGTVIEELQAPLWEGNEDMVMDKVVIKYSSKNEEQISDQLMAAVIEILKRSSADKVFIKNGHDVFTYAGNGGNLNGL